MGRQFVHDNLNTNNKQAQQTAFFDILTYFGMYLFFATCGGLFFITLFSNLSSTFGISTMISIFTPLIILFIFAKFISNLFISNIYIKLPINLLSDSSTIGVGILTCQFLNIGTIVVQSLIFSIIAIVTCAYIGFKYEVNMETIQYTTQVLVFSIIGIHFINLFNIIGYFWGTVLKSILNIILSSLMAIELSNKVKHMVRYGDLSFSHKIEYSLLLFNALLSYTISLVRLTLAFNNRRRDRNN